VIARISDIFPASVPPTNAIFSCVALETPISEKGKPGLEGREAQEVLEANDPPKKLQRLTDPLAG